MVMLQGKPVKKQIMLKVNRAKILSQDFVIPSGVIAIGQKMKSTMLRGDDKSTMSLTSEESLQAGEYIIERGIFKIKKSDGSLTDQGKYVHSSGFVKDAQ